MSRLHSKRCRADRPRTLVHFGRDNTSTCNLAMWGPNLSFTPAAPKDNVICLLSALTASDTRKASEHNLTGVFV